MARRSALAAAMLLAGACDCGGPRTREVTMASAFEAGPDDDIAGDAGHLGLVPDQARSALPLKLEPRGDEGSVEKSVEQLKALGLEHLIEGHGAPGSGAVDPRKAAD